MGEAAVPPPRAPLCVREAVQLHVLPEPTVPGDQHPDARNPSRRNTEADYGSQGDTHVWVSSSAAPDDMGSYAGGFGAGSSGQNFPSTGFGSGFGGGSGFGSKSGFGSAGFGSWSGFGTSNYTTGAGFGDRPGFGSGPGFGAGTPTGFASKGGGFGAGKGARHGERPPAGKAGGRARRPGVDMRCPACGYLSNKRPGRGC